MITWELTGIFICLVMSGLFSGSETALTSLSLARLEQLLKQYPRWAGSLRFWRDNPGSILTSILIGNNLFNITASVLATNVVNRLFDDSAIAIAIGGMTFLLLFSSEITPKAFARVYAPQLAPLAMNIVGVFHTLVYPVTWLITTVVNMLMSLLGRHRLDHNQVVTLEELNHMLLMAGQQGTLSSDQKRLLSAVFRFENTTTREVMSPRTQMLSVSVQTSRDELMAIAKKSGYSRLPVFSKDSDNIQGIFYTKKLLHDDHYSNRENYLAGQILPPLFVPESMLISEVFRIMQKKRSHMVIVVDEFGGTSGFITMEDILEELMGEIQDEQDKEDVKLLKTDKNIFRADASISISDLTNELGLEFPDERSYESLGGFVIEQAGELPALNWEHKYNNHIFKVSERSEQRLIVITIEAPSEPQTLGEG